MCGAACTVCERVAHVAMPCHGQGGFVPPGTIFLSFDLLSEFRKSPFVVDFFLPSPVVFYSFCALAYY